MNVGQIFEHRDYDPTTFQADLALIRLTHPAIMSDFIKPICLPDTDRYVHTGIQNTLSYIVGFLPLGARRLAPGH